LKNHSNYYSTTTPEVKAAYGDAYLSEVLKNMHGGQEMMKSSLDPSILGKTISGILLSGKEKRRMLVGASAYVLYFMDHIVPEWMFRAFSRNFLEPKGLPAAVAAREGIAPAPRD
jgi:hypothetical protein